MKVSCMIAFVCVAFTRSTGATTDTDITTFTADGCLGSGTSHSVAASTTGAVRCCRGSNFCHSEHAGTCFGKDVSFTTAQATCSSMLLRLCTLAELQKGTCCGTGCSYDSEPVWYDNCATNPCVHGSCKSTENSYTCTCDAGFTGTNCGIMITTFTADGCSGAGTSPSVAASIAGAAVRCCSDNDFCDSDSAGTCFGKDVSFATAKATCTSFGLRLCSLTELENNCCGTGCGYDNEPVWFDTCAPCFHGSCTIQEGLSTCTCDVGFTGTDCDTMTNTAVGCLGVGTSPSVAGSTTGAFRCCGDNDFCASEFFGACFPKDYSFAAAQEYCGFFNWRLCTLAELENNCCGTGCSLDNEPLWYDNCAANPCVHGSCKSRETSYTCTCDVGFTGTNCDIRTSTEQKCGGYNTPTPAIASTVVCCRSDWFGSCVDNEEGAATFKCFPRDVSFTAAQAACRSFGHRLCTYDELYNGACCGKNGCGHTLTTEVWFEDCERNRCLHGSCVPTDTAPGFRCVCDASYAGTLCENLVSDSGPLGN